MESGLSKVNSLLNPVSSSEGNTMRKAKSIKMPMKHYPIVRNWKRIYENVFDDEAQEVLWCDFNQYTEEVWGIEFDPEEFPAMYADDGWRFGKKGRPAQYWDWIKPGACHWLVNFYLRLAILTEPSRKWRIVSSQKHSTVWDGDVTIFDPNYLALRVTAQETYRRARHRGVVLDIGEYLDVGGPIIEADDPIREDFMIDEIFRRKRLWRDISFKKYKAA